jgi:hypothetical protein
MVGLCSDSESQGLERLREPSATKIAGRSVLPFSQPMEFAGACPPPRGTGETGLSGRRFRRRLATRCRTALRLPCVSSKKKPRELQGGRRAAVAEAMLAGRSGIASVPDLVGAACAAGEEADGPRAVEGGRRCRAATSTPEAGDRRRLFGLPTHIWVATVSWKVLVARGRQELEKPLAAAIPRCGSVRVVRSCCVWL